MAMELSQKEWKLGFSVGPGQARLLLIWACTASVWRHLAAGGLTRGRERLAAGVELLKVYRDRDGGWRRFPFHYTLLALTGMNGKGVVDEMQVAAPRLEQMLKRRGRGDRFDLRRRAVAERILARA